MDLGDDTIEMATAAKWRAWLKKNHDRSNGVWLVFYKKHAGIDWLGYDASVEEALCWGWVDSLVRRIDDDRYRQKFTPRKPRSKWSASNKARIERLVAGGRMQAPGMALVEAARRDGSWDDLPDAERHFDEPAELTRALAKSKQARAGYDQLAPSHRRQYIQWVASAKKPETRERRAAKARDMLLAGEKLGMK